MKEANEVIIKKIDPLLKARCPHCKKEQIINAKKYQQTCAHCGKGDYLNIESGEPIDSYAALILRVLHQHNEVVLSAPKWNKSEVDIIAKMFKRANIGIEVGNGEMSLRAYNKQRCLQCGTCNNCGTYFKKAEYNIDGMHICPSCKSIDLRMTQTETQDTCPKCGNKEVKEIKKIMRYRLSLKKLRMFWKQDE